MITTDDYFLGHAGHGEITGEHEENAAALLKKVNELLAAAEADGVTLLTNPKTTTQVSGEANGGWRPSGSTVGAKKSKHKIGHAVDVYDPYNALDKWATDEILEEFGLYAEDESATPGWLHLQDIPPGSGKRRFIP